VGGDTAGTSLWASPTRRGAATASRVAPGSSCYTTEILRPCDWSSAGREREPRLTGIRCYCFTHDGGESVRDWRVMPGAIVVAFVYAFSRWGTNIGVSPIFIGDILIGLSLLHVLVSNKVGGEARRDTRVSGRVTHLFTLFFIYFGFRFLFSIGQSSTLDWLRDGVPYAYCALAFLSAYAVARSGAETRTRTVRLFRWALTVHIIWVSAITVTAHASGFDVLPFSSAPLFELRPDIDVALSAIAAAASLRQVILGRRRWWNLLGVALSVTIVLVFTGTRAGQVSLLAALTLSFAFTYAGSGIHSRRQIAMLISVPILFTAVALVLPNTTAGERLIATVAPSLSESSSVVNGAEGTQRARDQVWGGVVEWTNKDTGRMVLGSGFGNNFLEQSGTLSYLEGTTYSNVRSPHNWFIGTYARLGIIGTILIVWWLLELGVFMFRSRHWLGQDDLVFISAMTLVSIVPVATFGVVLEAPFGAIPFFWASGVLMASRPRRPNDRNQRRSVHRGDQVMAPSLRTY